MIRSEKFMDEVFIMRASDNWYFVYCPHENNLNNRHISRIEIKVCGTVYFTKWAGDIRKENMPSWWQWNEKFYYGRLIHIEDKTKADELKSLIINDNVR